MYMQKNEAVVLFHGLGLHALFMQKIATSLQEEGYAVHNIDYPSRKHNIETLTAYVYQRLENKVESYRRVHFIGHSLGGILVRNLMYRYGFFNRGCVIALAPPNQGSLLVDRFRKWPLVSWYFGPSFTELGTDSFFLKRLVYLPDDYYVIAGNRSKWTCFGSLFDTKNDGVVEVERTKMEGMYTSHLSVFPVTHFTMLFNEKVMKQISDIIKDDWGSW